MMLFLAMLLIQVAAPVSPPPPPPPPENFSETLYWASASAAGASLCDRQRSARYKGQFDRRYGARVRALVAYHARTFGPDPGFIIVTSCRASLGSKSQQRRDHELAMARFDAQLRDVERRFGPAGS